MAFPSDSPEVNLTQGDQYAGQVISSNSSRTVGQNIDARIEEHLGAIERLRKVKSILETGSILDVNLSDLQQAMRW